MRAAALMMDLKKSRVYTDEERSRIQYFLISISEQMNNLFMDSMYRKLRFNGGDEIQGLFVNSEAAFLCLRMFERVFALCGIECRFGMGIGEWTTVIDSYDTFYQDGPVYHRARNAIDKTKRNADYKALICSASIRDRQINAMLDCDLKLLYNSKFSNEMALLLEYLYPIGEINKNAFCTFISGSIEVINHYIQQRDQSRYITKAQNKSPLITVCDMEKIIGTIRQSEQEDLFYQYAHPFGAVSELAELTGLPRTRVSRGLIANTYAERALALAIICELHTYAKEMED